jgi:hypothetical protein
VSRRKKDDERNPLRGDRVHVGATGIPRRMQGLPVYELAAPVHFPITAKDVRDGKPLDCDRCAISLAAKRQLGSPVAHIGKSHAYFAVPDPEGVPMRGHENTNYIMVAAILGSRAQALMRANDLGGSDITGQVISLIPRKSAQRPERKASTDTRPGAHGPASPSTEPKPRKPRRKAIQEEGIRNYSGRVWA